MLVSVDVDDHQEVLKELTKVSVVNNLTIMLAWSYVYLQSGRELADAVLEQKPRSWTLPGNLQEFRA